MRCERFRTDSLPATVPPVRHVGRFLVRLAALAVLAMLAGPACSVARAQQLVRTIPSDEHYDSFTAFLDGNYVTAGRYFASTSRIKSTAGVWIDSIPYHAMIGECKYQMGDLAGALEQYSAALQVAVSYADWLMYLDLVRPVAPSTTQVRNPPTWGTPTRVIRVAQVPDRVGIRTGNTQDENQRVLQEGGVISQQVSVMVYANEIARCTVLALRRRAEILGPTGEHDALTNQLVTVLQRRLAPTANHWTQSWISLELGLALAAKGKPAEAAAELTKSLLMGGMDHPLTPTALLELGKLAFQAGDFPAAGTYFMEATYSGALQVVNDYTQYDVMAEAFRWAMVTHLVSGKREFFTPLTMAVDWARRSRIPVLEASILLVAAENSAAIGDAPSAAALTTRAAVVMRNRECLKGELGARFQYATGHMCYLQGDVKRGATALNLALSYARAGGSRRLFQIILVDRLFTGGSITTRQADLLYAKVLRDPTPLDWAADPLETIAVLKSEHEAAYEHWMLLALDRKEKDVALRISDALRRHRFYTTLPLGGRVLNLRWTLEAPQETLTQTALLHRQELLNRYPEYGQLTQESHKVRAELAALPAAPENEDQRQRQTELQTQLMNIGRAQEQMLWSIGLGRERGEFVFPPTTDVTVVQQQMQPRQRVLGFISISTATYAFMLGKETYSAWAIEKPTKITEDVRSLLRGLGQYDRNQPVGSKELSSVAWKEAGAAILQQLTGNAPPDAWDEFDELIIVPDRFTWYIPFEALQIQKGDEKVALIDKVRIRYVPTISLAVPDKSPRKRQTRTAVVTGEVFPKSDETASIDVATQLHEADPNVFAVSYKPVPPPLLLPKLVDRLVVLNDLDNDTKRPYDWAPLASQKGKAAATLEQWMVSPWGGPDQVILPGFHTLAESGLKRAGRGDELFLTVCGMMASGSRTILLSRWRDGGRTSHDLVREFVRELPHRPASEAWQRSVQLARESELDFDREPRVKAPATESTFKAEHPFFWSGYLLVDTGVQPIAEE